MQGQLPLLICFVVLIPFVIWDALRFAHRLIGPLVPIQRAIQAVTEEEKVHPIVLRKDDYLQELKTDLNLLLESLQRRGLEVLESPASPATANLSTTPQQKV